MASWSEFAVDAPWLASSMLICARWICVRRHATGGIGTTITITTTTIITDRIGRPLGPAKAGLTFMAYG